MTRLFTRAAKRESEEKNTAGNVANEIGAGGFLPEPGFFRSVLRHGLAIFTHQKTISVSDLQAAGLEAREPFIEWCTHEELNFKPADP